MNTTKKTSKTAPLAHRIPAEVSPVIAAYAEWLTEQTGYAVDPMSVYIGSQLRSTFQKSDDNQKRIADATKERAAREAAKAVRKAEREAAAAKKAAGTKGDKPKAAKNTPTTKTAPTPQRRRPLKGSTVATEAGVVIAEQRHIDATKEA